MSKILMCGDLHGNWKPIRDLYETMLKKQPLTKNDVLIILGDFSANFFFNHRDAEYKKKLGKYKITYFIIRGNHEERPSICMNKNPNAWHMEEFWGNQVYVENDYPYIKYALDMPAKYEIPTAQGDPIKTLVLPGAYSVDKYYRLQHGMTWFKNEQLTQQEMWDGTELASKAKWDLILSHTCPIAWEPTDLFLSQIDQSTVDSTMERWLGNIEYKTDYTLWCFGHFHQTRIYPKDWENNRQSLMLYNDVVLDLNSFFMDNYRNSDISSVWNSLIKIESY